MAKLSLLDAMLNSSVIVYSGSTISGKTDVHTFLDDNGNVTQIKKSSKSRFKFYIDPEITFINNDSFCLIGVGGTDEICSFGVALGYNDNPNSEFSGIFAVYE